MTSYLKEKIILYYILHNTCFHYFYIFYKVNNIHYNHDYNRCRNDLTLVTFHNQNHVYAILQKSNVVI